jgi:hypothetical protein
MISVLGLLAVLTLCWAADDQVTARATPLVPKIGDLLLAPCSCAVAGAKANLRIGALTRREQTYVGDYRFTVTPYFFKNEKGTFTIGITDADLKKFVSGMPVDFTGQATATDSGKTRPIEGTATPSDPGQGTIRLRFTAENRELRFTTSYRVDRSKDSAD